MSQNNQNEYDIIDVSSGNFISNDSVRYPLANNPNHTLQNINYKDYLNMSEGNSVELFGDSQAFNRVATAQTGLAIVGGALGALGVPFAGEIAGLFSFILDLFWPSQETDVWEMIMDQVQGLIDQSITANVRSQAIAKLEGLGRGLEAYQELLVAWLENRNNARTRSLIKQQYVALEQIFTTGLPEFSVQNQEVPLLGVYAQAANLHLLLLRDVSIFGAEWGFEDYEIDVFYNRQMRYTAEYANYCVEWYNKGLDRLKGTDRISWMKYHQFRREMTLLVLDIVALFPNYDARRYPLETEAQLTREVYTDPIVYNPEEFLGGFCNSWTSDNQSDFSQIENAVIRPPHVFDTIASLEINTARGRIALNNTAYIDFWAGHSLTFRYPNDSARHQVQYGTITSEKNSFPFEVTDVVQVNTTAANLANAYQQAYGAPRAVFQLVNRLNGAVGSLTYSKTHTAIQACTQSLNTNSEIPRLPVSPGVTNLSTLYTHRISHITSYNFSNNLAGNRNRYGNFPVFVWTHRSAEIDNKIYANKITQIPAVKALWASSEPYPVVRGPGFTGGDIARLPNNPNIGLRFLLDPEPGVLFNRRFRVRIRFACDSGARVILTDETGINSETIVLNQTMTTENPRKYDDFQYIESRNVYTLTRFPGPWIWRLGAQSADQTRNVYIDRIEFIPLNPALEAENDLETAKKAVNALFTNRKDTLQISVTDYQINQAANLIECVSDEVYPNEKRLLFDAVKEAKRLSTARNLLEDTDFHAINGGNGWTGSTGIEIVEGDLLFKDRSLRLPSAREIERETYPTYIYQKIEESRLKPNTRYSLRGFIGSSQDLEIYVLRHQAYRVIKNVSDNLLPNMRPINACGGVDRCSQQKYVNNSLELNSSLSNGIGAADSHEFSIHMDTGELNYNEDTGIWVVFKITTTDGYATLGNLELVEEGPLSGDTLERVRKQEKQWQDQMARRRAETETRYGAAKQAIDRLFIDYQDQQLSPGTDISDLTAAQNVVQSIPYVYNDMLPEIPGMNYTSVTELTNRLQQAWDLYDQRNSIPNGDFRYGLNDWNAKSGANVQQVNHTSVLVIPNWDSQASQEITVQPNRRYVLRVTARKEGSGDGYVTIRDGAKYTETLTFNTCDYNGSNVYQEQALYTNDVYNTQSANIQGSNSAYHTQASNTDRYNMNGMYNDQTSYVTKTVEFIPHTEQVWIEMSETEGVFYIESVELIVKEN
ncbi:insecticidal delta-endotoxin Cry8Ea1 family protein [Bacillus thuringiensis]|nr:insecticidal delta-endotoxin Cry8Ea1 family protein [Bacillus thuringiensis]